APGRGGVAAAPKRARAGCEKSGFSVSIGGRPDRDCGEGGGKPQPVTRKAGPQGAVVGPAPGRATAPQNAPSYPPSPARPSSRPPSPPGAPPPPAWLAARGNVLARSSWLSALFGW